MSKHVHYVEPVGKDGARGIVARVYAQLERDLGTVPEPFTLHSPAPTLLAGIWMAFRETLIAGDVPRGTKEAVAAAISDVNRCPWCVDAHTAMLYAAGNEEAVPLVTSEAHGQVANRALADVVEWARTTRSPGAGILVEPPFSSDCAPEIIGTAVVFHYLNRMATVLLSETFLPAPHFIKRTLQRVGGWMFSASARKAYAPGVSLDLLPPAPLPDAFAWAAPAPHIAGAFARWADVVEDAGADVLTPAVRSCVQEQIQAWDGADMPLSRRWVDDAVTGLTDAELPAARLALLAALAPHQVDAGVIDAFRATQPADEALVAALAWGSFTATRRISTWLHSSAQATEPPVRRDRSTD